MTVSAEFRGTSWLCSVGRELGRAFEVTMLAFDKRFIKNSVSENPNLKLNGE